MKRYCVRNYNMNIYRIYFVIILSFLILSFVGSSILIYYHTIHGEDMIFHVKRIIELWSSYNHNNYLPLYSFNTNRGVATMGMYPYLNLIPILIFHRFGISLLYSILGFFLFNLFLSFILSFFCSLRFSKSLMVSYIFSLVYTLSSVFIIDNFLSMDLGVVSAYIFLPLVVFGFIYLMNSNDYIMLSIGVLLIILSQIPAALITIVFLLLWLLININIWRKELFLSLFRSIFITLSLTSFFWIPFFDLILNNRIKSPIPILLRGCSIKQFMEYISVFAIIGACIFPFYWCKTNKYDRQMFCLSLFIIVLSSKLMPYGYISSTFKFLNKLQYPFRLLIIPQLLLSFLFSVSLSKYLHKSHKYFLFCLLVIFVILGNVACQSEVVRLYPSLTKLTRNVNSSQPHGRGLIVTNSRSIKYIDSLPLINLVDYFPTSIGFNGPKYVKDNDVLFPNGHMTSLVNDGYNKFYFNNQTYYKNVSLPIVKYNNENIKICVNGYFKHFSTNRMDLIDLRNIQHGHNIIKIYCYKNLNEEILISIIVLMGLVTFLFGFGIFRI